jgi:hypothetical protein
VGDLPLKKPKLVCDSFKYHSSWNPKTFLTKALPASFPSNLPVCITTRISLPGFFCAKAAALKIALDGKSDDTTWYKTFLVFYNFEKIGFFLSIYYLLRWFFNGIRKHKKLLKFYI